MHVHSPSTHAGVPHRQLKAPVQPPPGLVGLETGPGSPQLPTQVHSPSTHVGVPHKQLKAPVQPFFGGGFTAWHVPVHVGGIEWVQATTEQNSSAPQPVVTGGLPATLQRWPTASVVVSGDPSSTSAAEHPSDASNAPRATAVKPILTKVCMVMQVSLVLIGSMLMTRGTCAQRQGSGVEFTHFPKRASSRIRLRATTRRSRMLALEVFEVE